MKKEKRFQECSPIEKIWRYRWYLLIPFEAVYTWLAYIYYSKCEMEEDEDLSWADFRLHWSLAIGMAQRKMKWYYTSKETTKYFATKLKKKHSKKNG